MKYASVGEAIRTKTESIDTEISLTNESLNISVKSINDSLKTISNYSTTGVINCFSDKDHSAGIGFAKTAGNSTRLDLVIDSSRYPVISSLKNHSGNGEVGIQTMYVDAANEKLVVEFNIDGRFYKMKASLSN